MLVVQVFCCYSRKSARSSALKVSASGLFEGATPHGARDSKLSSSLTTRDSLMQLLRRIPPSDYFHLALQGLGNPSIIAMHASLPSSAAPSLTKTNVERATSHLLNQYSLLRCGLQRSPGHPAALCMRREVKPGEVAVFDEGRDVSTTELLSRALEEGKSFSWDRGPLWKVQLVAGGVGRATRIVLSIAHLISDGIGARRLFSDFLKLLKGYPTCPPPPCIEFPPTRDDLPCFIPSAEWVKSANAAIAQSDPSTVTQLRPPIPAPPLPPTQPGYTAIKHLCSLPPFMVGALKAQAHLHSVDTLHPLLHGVALAAVSLASTDSMRTPTSSYPTFIFRSCTDRSLRAEGVHPRATGVYTTNGSTERWRLSTGFGFFMLCRWYQDDLHDAQLRREYDWQWGYEWGVGKGNQVRDVWDEEYQRRRIEEGGDGRWKWESSACTSNLGVLDETGWEAEGQLSDVCWAQTALPGCAALLLNVS